MRRKVFAWVRRTIAKAIEAASGVEPGTTVGPSCGGAAQGVSDGDSGSRPPKRKVAALFDLRLRDCQ
jgi:hypothetical protein